MTASSGRPEKQKAALVQNSLLVDLGVKTLIKYVAFSNKNHPGPFLIDSYQNEYWQHSTTDLHVCVNFLRKENCLCPVKAKL